MAQEDATWGQSLSGRKKKGGGGIRANPSGNVGVWLFVGKVSFEGYYSGNVSMLTLELTTNNMYSAVLYLLEYLEVLYEAILGSRSNAISNAVGERSLKRVH